MPSQLWITQAGLRAALQTLKQAGAHAQTPVYLAMKLAGVNKATMTSFGSGTEMREKFFGRFLSVPDNQYYNPFLGTIHTEGYPHGSQYTVAREVRKPRWRDSLDWEEPAGRGVTNYNVRFLPDYVDTLREELLDNGPLPFWAIAALAQAKSGALPPSIRDANSLIDHWGRVFHLTQDEKTSLFSMAVPPTSVTLIGEEELTQADIDELIVQIARHSKRQSRSESDNRASDFSVRSSGKSKDFPLNLIIYGPPGTGKTRELLENYIPAFTDDDGTERFVLTTFHPSYFYEDFVEGLRPNLVDEDRKSSEIAYSIVDGVFKRICSLAESDPEKPHAIFIDEINRGKIDSLFGDIISLIDDDKRDIVSVTLPYSKQKFSVPSNLHIIGTMNTADRSIALLDVALRRRFDFIELPPNEDTLRSMLEANGLAEGRVDGVDVPRLLSAINDRLEETLGRDRLIGHGWLANVSSLATLRAAFSRKIIPLLCEYFYDEQSRVAEILGDGPSTNNGFFAWRKADDSISHGASLQRLKPEGSWTAETFKQVYLTEVSAA